MNRSCRRTSPITRKGATTVALLGALATPLAARFREQARVAINPVQVGAALTNRDHERVGRHSELLRSSGLRPVGV